MNVLKSLRKFKNNFSKYENSIEVLIARDRILHNLRSYKENYKDFYFSPVLKSNAYGHGLVEVASILEVEKDIPFFIVDSLYEARKLRNENIKKDIFILGYTRIQNVLNFNNRGYIFNVTSLEDLKNISKNLKQKIRIHIKLDTGMGRQGLLEEDIVEAINILKENKNLILEGICSHFADAENIEKTFTNTQLNKWKRSVDIFKKENFKDLKYFHISATSGVEVIDKDINNLVRLGIGLYGIDVLSRDINLLPAMRVESIVVSLKDLKLGDSIGYGHTFTLEKDMRVAIVPVGYFEGVDRRLSNIGKFKIKNDYCDILGRVSMNMTSIDVTNIKDLRLEDKVVVLSENNQDINSAINIACLTNTIPYDILVHISPDLKRKIIKDFN